MMWNVCGLDGVKLQCGVECYGVILNVLWYGYTRLCIAGSEQFALSVLCCVLYNVSLVLFMCQQDSGVYTAFSVSLQRRLRYAAFNASSVQFSFLTVQLQGLQHTQSVVFSVSWVTVYGIHGLPTIIQCWQCSVYSVVSGVQSLQRSVSVQCLQRSGCVLFSGSFSVCTLQCLQCSEHWLFTKSLSCSESTL